MSMDVKAYLDANLERLLAKCNPDRLVVQSMPFGALIDNDTREQFAPAISDPDVAYGIVAAVKLAARERKAAA